MSSRSGTEQPYSFGQEGTFALPYELTVPASLVLEADTATATFDGTSASGSFVPCLSLYSPSGTLIASIPIQTATLTTGDVAEVSWFPFAPAAISGGGGSGIQFDTDNEGGWLDVFTNDKDASDFGMRLQDNSGGGIYLFSEGSGADSSELRIGTANGVVEVSAEDFFLISASGTAQSQVSLAGPLLIRGGDNITLEPGHLGTSGDVQFTLAAGHHLIVTSLPTSAAGLPAGALWNNGGVVNVA